MSDDEYMIVMAQGQFEFRKVAQERIMQDLDGSLRLKKIPALYPGEALSVTHPRENIYHIIKHPE